jgi:hypothetical protein
MIGYYHVSKNDTKNNADFTLGHDTLSEDVTVNDINLKSFEIKSGLNSKFWIGDKLKPLIRQGLLKIVDDFYESIEIDDIIIEDVIFTGSLAGYNWSKYSDIDIHIIVDYDKIKIPNELLLDYFEMKKKIFNIKYSDLNFYGYPIEIYVDGSNIILKKFESNCIFCGNSKKLVEYKGKLVCDKCLEKISEIKEAE